MIGYIVNIKDFDDYIIDLKIDKIYDINYIKNNDNTIHENRYHFYKDFKDILLFVIYDFDIYEIDTLDGNIHQKLNSLFTDKFKVIRKIKHNDVNNYIRDNLKELTEDPDPIIRTAVAKQGYELFYFAKNDPDPIIRILARQKINEKINENNIEYNSKYYYNKFKE